VELPSILDWKTDSGDVAKTMHEATMKQIAQVKEIMAKLEPGDFSAWDLIVFAYLQLIPGALNANVHATVRVTEVLTDLQVLSIRLERLTKWLIGLTFALVFLTIVLLIATVRHW
jgi:hypothetical protein